MQSVLTAEQEMLRTATRQFLAKTAPVDQTRENVPSEHGFDLAWWARGAELGWTGLLAAPEFGGGSMTDAKLVDLALVALELGRVVAPGPLAATNVVAGTLSDAANAENHRDLIEGLVVGTQRRQLGGVRARPRLGPVGHRHAGGARRGPLSPHGGQGSRRMR